MTVHSYSLQIGTGLTTSKTPAIGSNLSLSPLSTRIFCPLIPTEAGQERKTATSAISSGGATLVMNPGDIWACLVDMAVMVIPVGLFRAVSAWRWLSSVLHHVLGWLTRDGPGSHSVLSDISDDGSRPTIQTSPLDQLATPYTHSQPPLATQYPGSTHAIPLTRIATPPLIN